MAATVRRFEGPQFVAEAESDITEGDWFGLEQCDGCGNNTYQAVMHGGRWFLRCTWDPNGLYAREGVGPFACGAEWPVYRRPAEEVVF
jgi:hypothetical protein